MADRYAVTGEQLVVEVSPGETILNLFNSPVTPVTRGEVFYFSASAGGPSAEAEHPLRSTRQPNPARRPAPRSAPVAKLNVWRQAVSYKFSTPVLAEERAAMNSPLKVIFYT